MKRLFFLFIILTGSVLAVGSTPTLIAHYKMNDNLATDVILDGTGNHNGAVKDVGGTATSAFHSVAGRIIRAQDLDGADDHIEIADHDDFTPALTPFSISAWAYMRDATEFGIATKGILNVNGEWRFWSNTSDRVEIIFMDESVASCYIGRRSFVSPPENKWIHLVMTYDGGIISSGVKIYQDAVRIDEANAEGNVAFFESVENLNHDVWIGRRSGNYANGLIDNVMFFSVELTQDEVNILYNAGSGTEIPAELDSKISPRRGNLSPLPLRRRWEF